MIDRRLNIVRICRMFNWTFQEYKSQPQWFLDLIFPMLETEDKVAKIQAENEELKAQGKR